MPENMEPLMTSTHPLRVILCMCVVGCDPLKTLALRAGRVPRTGDAHNAVASHSGREVTEIAAHGVWEALHERFGDDLRAVTRYEGTDFETKMREDVRARYTDRQDQRIVDETIVSQLGMGSSVAAFEAGDLQSLVRVFDEAWVLTWPDAWDQKSGFIVSVQRDGEGGALGDADACLDILRDGFASLDV